MLTREAGSKIELWTRGTSPRFQAWSCHWHAANLRCSVVLDSLWPMDVAYQAPLSKGFPRWQYWSGLSFLLQGIFPTQGLNPCLWHLQHWLVDSSPTAQAGKPQHAARFGQVTQPPGAMSLYFETLTVLYLMELTSSKMCDSKRSMG